MQQEIVKNGDRGNLPAFSVRIDITNTGKKLIFEGYGDVETSRLFLEALKRLSERIKSSELTTELIYKVNEVEENEVKISITKEEIEDILFAILVL